MSSVATRCVSTSAPESKEPKIEAGQKPAVLDCVVDKLNDSIKKHPGETIAVLFASDIGSIGAMYGVISLTGLEFSPEFALAFAASRPFRRFRLPLDLAVAAGVAKIFPVLSKVRLSDLTGALPNPGFMSKAMDKAKEVVDSYGAAYMMGSRLAGVGVVCSLYALIKQGVDVMPILASLGMGEVGEALGGYAAAVVFGSAIYPFTLGVSGYIVPVVAKLRRTIMP
ncbi:Ammonium Transporter (Amt) Family [Phytophthora nicotianae]|uniref:Ammonium Transporter (Amt) Family n=1 Tax=Phytophthora nicotianae TaxID=4792 RepID=A0A0W8DNS9_PHYNI|nr:Ammonium Transporter (Amt) Family [Phytophthora nicotianae]